MANKQEEIPEWFLWLGENFGKVLLLVVLLLGLLFGVAYYIEHRLSGIESQLTYVPPRSYQPPDLSQYDSGDVTPDQLADRHLVYVPVYSHIYYEGGSPYPLETTLSIRNVSPSKPIYVSSVQYFDTSGKLARRYVDQLIKLAPLETIEFLVERHDSSGGSGANFLVDWRSDSKVDAPLIETVMVGVVGPQGIGFGKQGIEVTPDSEP
ncbi:DUF3124 domain-containing protein [Roseiconus nitratireducens]|uniref:DUF3124 domain-containing protein n=1 Tax=Roseiconus nitratireducens TaxID=2605748 RepID=A0A5M6D674_9BACT|nr:DUF3124 domain-containing protein [Roseiconus nitratireducens]KAA5543027.1 DUF3124 domain-containing protein [Roseiconus nitratireducens]